MRARIIRLEAPAPEGARRFLSGLGPLAPSEQQRRSHITLTRTGRFHDPRYGHFDITAEMLASMVRNFETRVLGQDVFVDVSHKPEDGAAARVLSLRVDGNRLRAEVEWTDFGIAAVKERGFRYLSAEYHEDFVDNESGRAHGPTLLGAGLTVRPVIKRLDPITLSMASPEDAPMLLHPELVRQLSDHLETTTMNWLENLKKTLAALGLSTTVIKQLCDAAKAAAAGIGDDEPKLRALAESFEAAGREIAAQAPQAQTVQLSIPAATGVTAEDVRRLLAEETTARETRVRELAQRRDQNLTAYRTAVEAAEGLGEDTRRALANAETLITAEMSADQVRALAEHQIALGNQLEASRQLANMGFAASGSPRITMDEGNGIRKLALQIRTNLANRASSDTLRKLSMVQDESKLSRFVQKALAHFDEVNAERLHQEVKALAGGPVNTGDMSLPASYQREVILETLQDLRILGLVDADVEPTAAATHTIPYETRDTSAVYNNGIVYEGGAIRTGGVSQANVLAYIAPMKIAMDMTNEAMHFSRMNSSISWDAWARNLASNSQLAREFIARRLMNELQRSADVYAAVEVVGEAFDSQLDGSTSVLKTAEFPIVRPYQTRDLQGNTVGSPECPIAPVLNGVAITEWDGTGEQTAGTYWRVTNYNLGYIQLVDEAGDPVTPTDTGVNTLGYWQATNVAKVDTDIPVSSYYERHMNKLLQAVGARKALLSQDRYVKPDFGLVSETLHNAITDAETFAANFKRDGTDTDSMGDLARIKSIPIWGTNTSSDLGEERILIGPRGLVKYRIARLWSIGAPFEKVDSNGRPVGKKIAYGEEYSSICVPAPTRDRLTSVLAYSDSNR